MGVHETINQGQPSFARPLFTPVLSGLLEKRMYIWILLSVAVVQVALVAAGLPGWPCPIRSISGIPCPGCGLTRAAALLLEGEWQAGLALHAFSPLLLSVVLLMMIVGILPADLHGKTIDLIQKMEHKTGFAGWILLGLIGYWIARQLGHLIALTNS